MLSYQHLFHAGNPADVHKHALLSFALDYLTQKDKPLTYIETHAGRGLYDLTAPEAEKTGEARVGVEKLGPLFAKNHPLCPTPCRNTRAIWRACLSRIAAHSRPFAARL